MDPVVLSWAIAQSVGTAARSLADAYTSGTLSVRFADGRMVTYRSLGDVERALTSLYGVANTGSRRPAVTYAAFNRGW